MHTLPAAGNRSAGFPLLSTLNLHNFQMTALDMLLISLTIPLGEPVSMQHLVQRDINVINMPAATTVQRRGAAVELFL